MKKSVYQRPDKPMFLDVKPRRQREAVQEINLPTPVYVDAVTECHVTPEPVSDRMVSYLDAAADDLTLEPSAGTGALVKALLRAGHKPSELIAVERHSRLASSLNFEGIEVHNDCFLKWARKVKGKGEFQRIIMNPPFSKVRQHIKAALSLLSCSKSAALVALVPITFKHEDAQTMEELPADTFSAAKVNTKIIRIER